MLIILLSYLSFLLFLLWPGTRWRQRPMVKGCRYGLFYLFLLLIGSLGYGSSTGLIVSGLLPMALHLRHARTPSLRLLGGCCSVIIPLLSATWPALGFSSLVVWGPQPLYEQGREFLLSLSLPKMILVLAAGCVLSLHHKLRLSWPRFCAAWLLAVSLIGIADVMGIPQVFKWGAYLPWFLLINLSITVLAEELFFRLLMQETLTRRLHGQFARWSAALLTGVLFYFVHGFGIPDNTVAWIYLITSLSYAFFYAYYRNLLASVTLHFAVNVMHIVWLAYPL